MDMPSGALANLPADERREARSFYAGLGQSSLWPCDPKPIAWRRRFPVRPVAMADISEQTVATGRPLHRRVGVGRPASGADERRADQRI